MLVDSLIGKVVTDIKVEIRDFEYDGNIPLEESNSIIGLSTGEFFELPYNGQIALDLNPRITANQISIFNPRTHKTILGKFLNSFYGDNELIERNKKMVQGQRIISIYKYDTSKDFDESGRFGKCVIELESGYLIGEVMMAPTGTGHTGIWIFTSKDDLREKMGENIIHFDK